MTNPSAFSRQISTKRHRNSESRDTSPTKSFEVLKKYQERLHNLELEELRDREANEDFKNEQERIELIQMRVRMETG